MNKVELIEIFRTYPNKEWLNNYLDLLSEIITTNGLATNTDCFCTTISDNSINLNIGNRQVITSKANGNIILCVPNGENNILYDCSIKQPKKENENRDYQLFEYSFTITLPSNLKEIHLKFIKELTDKGWKSPYRKYHNKTLFDLIQDSNFRKEFFNNI